MSLYKIDVFFTNYITLICIIYTDLYHFPLHSLLYASTIPPLLPLYYYQNT